MAVASLAGVPDWRDPAAYSPLLKVERAGFAWEWLRRRPDFRKAALLALGHGARAERLGDLARVWHLHEFEDPRLEAPLARPVWAATGHPWVVAAYADRAAESEDSFTLERLAPFARMVVSARAQHVLLSDGCRSIRLDVTGAPLSGAPVRLSFEIAGLRALERPLLVLRRLRSLALRGRFATSLHPPIPQTRRLLLLLRTFDALAAGASHGDIASGILSNNLERRHWRVHSPSLRSRAQRLAKAARMMGAGGFWRLLD